MKEIKSHTDLNLWKESMKLVEVTYKLTRHFPQEELYGLTSQIKRSSISIPSNIAEGAGRKGKKEWIRFLYIAMGSLSELETQMLIAIRLEFIEKDQSYFNQIKYVRNMINQLIKSLNNT